MFEKQEKEEKKKSTIMEEFQEIDVTVGKLLEFVERFEKRFYPILEPINTAEPARPANPPDHDGVYPSATSPAEITCDPTTKRP